MTEDAGRAEEFGGSPADALIAAGGQRLVRDAETSAQAFAAEHELELAVLREDAAGRFRNPGPLRSLTMLMLLPSVVPLIGQTHFRLAGGGFEFAGMIASFACALLLAIIVGVAGGRPFDKHSFITFYWTAISCGGGALFAWWNGIPNPLLALMAAAGVLVVALVAVLQITRSRNPVVAKMRDEDAMDRSERLRSELATRLHARAGRGGSAALDKASRVFLADLVESTIPKPRNRTFGEPAAKTV